MLSYIRKRYHPLFHLRKLRAFRALQRLVDFDFWTASGAGSGMYVKFLRDLSLVLPHDGKEQKTRQVFIKMISELKPDVFIDIGANVGLYSWHAKRQEVPIILMFEPDRDNSRLLAKTIRANRMHGVFVLACAISDQAGISEFLEDQASGATGSLVDRSASRESLHGAYGMSHKVLAPTLSLDVFTDYCRNKKVFVKIDVEDAEDKIFAGGQAFFADVMPYVLVECFDVERLSLFRCLGYAIKPLQENSNYLLTPASSPFAVA
ncbi:FkbM family methyltransferase [Cyanobium sp. FGCU-6]|nr:FkbM family methyltransferase [Cyanobium sp. FGCU6]